MKLEKWSCKIIWHVSGLQAWQRQPEAQLHGWGAARNCNPARSVSGNIRANVKLRWSEFKYWNMITVLNRRPSRMRPGTNVYSWLPRKKRQGQAVGESKHTLTHTHTHYRVVNPRFDGLTLSYCCEGGKKNKRRVTLLITLTSPLRPEEEEEEDQCITKKKPEAFSLPLCPPVFSESRLPPGETSDWGTFLIALQFYNTFWHFYIFS